MQEFIVSYLVPVLFGSSGIVTILIGIILRYALGNGKLKREITKLTAVGDTVSTFASDITEIKAKQDYSEVIKTTVAKTVQDLLNEQVKLYIETIADMQRAVSVSHERVEQIAQVLQRVYVGENHITAVGDILAIAPTQTAMYKKELESEKLKNEIRKLKGDDAESIIVGVIGSVE